VNSSRPPTAEHPSTAWLSVSDELLWGFNHALSNRLAAITSITRILEYSDTGLDPLLTALSEEISTLERTLDLLRLVPRNPDGMAEPGRIEDILPNAVRLHQLRGDVRELEIAMHFEEESQPIRAEPASLTHALLTALACVSRSANAIGAQSITLGVQSTESRVVVVFQIAGGDAISFDQEICTPAEADLIKGLIGPDGGVLRQAFGGASDGVVAGAHLEIDLPSLLATRQREAEARRAV